MMRIRKGLVASSVAATVVVALSVMGGPASALPSEVAALDRSEIYSNWFRSADGGVGCRYSQVLNPSSGYMTGVLTCMAKAGRQVRIKNVTLSTTWVSSSSWSRYRNAPRLPAGTAVLIPREAELEGDMPHCSCIIKADGVICGVTHISDEEGVGYRLWSNGRYRDLSY